MAYNFRHVKVKIFWIFRYISIKNITFALFVEYNFEDTVTELYKNYSTFCYILLHRIYRLEPESDSTKCCLDIY